MAAATTSEGKRKMILNDNEEEISDSENLDLQNQMKYGRRPPTQSSKIFARAVVVICSMIMVLFSSREKEIIFASGKDYIEIRYQNIPCSNSYKAELLRFKACVPQQCGRLITDTLVTEKEVKALLELAEKGFALGKSDGGASILDLHSGALSHGQYFLNFYKIPEAVNVFTPNDFAIYNAVKNKIHEAVSNHFGIPRDSLYLTKPTFFSRLTNAPAMTAHDEYWHRHVDKETYSSFHYTSLVYLNQYERDFTGGRFMFVDSKNRSHVIEPREGRVSAFTSGAENPHYVERVKDGIRYAITISFTCDPTQAIADPQLQFD